MKIDDLFNDIYNKTYNNIFCYILSKCHNLEDIDDIIQNVYTDFYFVLVKKAKKLENHEAYLMQITKNKIFKYYTFKNKSNKSKEDTTDDEILLNIADDFDIEQTIFEKFTNETIWHETKKLNITTQKILILYFKADYKISEIAKCLEMKESSVKTKLYRGLNDLKTSLGGENL